MWNWPYHPKFVTNTVSSHSRRNQQCRGAVFTGNISYMTGHCAVVSYTCGNCHINLPNWQSSPYLPNERLLVNYRMAHGFYSSGILPSQYERVMEAANFGCIICALSFLLFVVYMYSYSTLL